MQIFVTSKCPKVCAMSLDDKRVVKQCLETAQILSTALKLHGCTDLNLYKKTHQNHPCVKWAAETRLNYYWLLEHFQALLSEYSERYGKTHACSKLLTTFLKHVSKIPRGPQTPFVNCASNNSLGICYKHVPNVCLAYQLYLNDRWHTDKRVPTWYGIAS